MSHGICCIKSQQLQHSMFDCCTSDPASTEWVLICSNEQHDSFLCITPAISPVLDLMTVSHLTVPYNNVQLPRESNLPTSGCTVTLYGCAGRHRREVEALQSAHDATQEELVQRVAYLQVPHPPLPTLHPHLHCVYVFCFWAAYRFWLLLLYASPT